jgi:hypothetical protein
MPQIEFAIGIADPSPNADGHATGYLRVGDFHEEFIVTLNYWSIEDYELNWMTSLKRLAAGADCVGLMTWMVPPDSSDHGRAWILYRERELVFLQDQLFPWPDVRPQFETGGQLVGIPNRRTHNDEGCEISEWCLPLAAVLEFLLRREPDS